MDQNLESHRSEAQRQAVSEVHYSGGATADLTARINDGQHQ